LPSSPRDVGAAQGCQSFHSGRQSMIEEKFEAAAVEQDLKALNEDMSRPEAIYYLAKTYDNLMKHYTKKRTYFLAPSQKPETLKAKMDWIRKLITLALQENVSPEIFMRAQFEELTYYKIFPAFPIFVSDKATERFHKWIEHNQIIHSDPVARQKAIEQRLAPEAEVALRSSIERFSRRLGKVLSIVGVLDEDMALVELKVMARIGHVQPEYLVVAPLTEKSDELKAKRTQAMKKLDKRMVKTLAAIRDRLREEIAEDKVYKYV
jgi:hypothetical protein